MFTLGMWMMFCPHIVFTLFWVYVALECMFSLSLFFRSVIVKLLLSPSVFSKRHTVITDSVCQSVFIYEGPSHCFVKSRKVIRNDRETTELIYLTTMGLMGPATNSCNSKTKKL